MSENTGNNKSTQPSIIQLKSLPVNTAQHIESDILEPLTFSDTEATWEFAPKGFLHPGSTLTLGFIENTDLANAFPFLNVGVFSVVKRAVLRTTAGRVICSIDDWNNLESIKSMFIHNSTNKEREQYLSGRMIDFGFNYLLDPSADAGKRWSTTKGAGYGLDNGLENVLLSTDALEGLSSQPHLYHGSGSTLQIKLHDLFPYMKSGNQLPLFLLPNERIQVQLFFSDVVGRVAVSLADNDEATEELLLDRTKCKIISDHTFYSNEIMENIRDQYQKGKTFEYVDYRLSKQSLTNTQANTINERNIGGAGMVVNSVLWNYADPNYSSSNLLGKYHSSGARADGVSVEDLDSNLYVNGEYLYSVDICNQATHFHNLKETGGMVPFVSRQLYSGAGSNGLGTTQSEYEGRSLVDNLGGHFFAQGFNTKGLNKRVDQLGIQLKSKCNLVDLGDADLTYTQRAWLEIRRYLVIKDGHLECYFV